MSHLALHALLRLRLGAIRLVRKPVLVPAGIKAEIFEHLEGAQAHRSAPRDHDLLARQDQPEARDGIEDFERGQRRIADLILHGGKGVTVDRDLTIAEALAVRGELLIRVRSC